MKQLSFEEKMAELEQDMHDHKMAEMTLPKRGKCIVDDTTATMDKEYFDELLEYSTSYPTGAFVGKRWKANLHVFPSWECSKCFGKFIAWEPQFCPVCREPTLVRYEREPKWVMRSYEKSNDPNQVKNVQRDIIIKESI